MFGYLCGTRKLDQDILKELIRQSNLYESVYRYVDKSTGELKEIHNAVFVGRDEHGRSTARGKPRVCGASDSTS